MILYSPSIFLQDYATRTFTGVSDKDAAPAFDNDRNSLVPSASANPIIDLDAGTGETRRASAIWMRTRGYTAASVQYGASNTQLASVTIPADGYTYAEFTSTTSKDWRIVFTGTGGVYEVYLCDKVADLDDVEKRPNRWEIARYPGIFIRSRNNDLISFQPFSFGGGSATITLEWAMLEDEHVDTLRAAWEGAVDRNLQFSVYPIKAHRPRHFFQARWESPFNFKPAGKFVANATDTPKFIQQGSIVMQETSISVLS